MNSASHTSTTCLRKTTCPATVLLHESIPACSQTHMLHISGAHVSLHACRIQLFPSCSVRWRNYLLFLLKRSVLML